MYLSAHGGDLEFGLFRDSGHPLNVPIDLMLLEGGVGHAKFIRITKLAQDAVRVSTHDGNKVVVNFTNAKDGLADDVALVGKLAEFICVGLDEKIAQTCETYLTSLLSKAIRESHGCLIAVISSKKIPGFLKDCIVLDPRIDLSESVEAVRSDSAAITQLQALESLICGMFRSDGIVVFNGMAQVLAYNAFIKVKTTKVVGGARRRAYEAMCDKLGKGLRAAFFQSQDGSTELRES
jgi:hypothetical protein